jgi:class 3 adenylate cyclase
VALFVDIAGFTELSRSMDHDARSAADDLSDLLNTAFDHWITAIRAYGGCVAKFAGDALIAVWRNGPDSRLTEAVEAAEAIIRAMARLSRQHPISARCGIGSGQLTAWHVGSGLDHHELTIGGPALIGAIEACGRAPMNGVAQSVDLSPAGLGEPSTTPFIAPEVIASFVPPQVRQRIEAGLERWIAEMRLVSLVFVGLPQPGLSLSEFDTLISTLGRQLAELGGTFNKINVDDKGVSALIVFGAPIAHEDDPSRAVAGAQAVSRHLTAHGVAHSIGVASGRAFCGVVGNAVRREFTVIGDAANRAARLMQLGSGIVADMATAGYVRAVAWTEPRKVRVKGIDEPLLVVEPLATTQATDTISPGEMVGRHRERQLCTRALLRAKEGSAGSTILIAGEAGIGKTTLARFVVDQARRDGLMVIEGYGSRLGEAPPYGAFRTAFEGLLGDDADHALRQLAGGDPWIIDRLPLLAEALGLELSDNELTGDLRGRVRAENTLEVLTRVLAGRIDRPALLVMEDAHTFDSASLTLLVALRRRLPHAALVITHRPFVHTPPPQLAELAGMPTTTTMTLAELGATDLAALTALRLGATELSEEVVRFISDRAGGSPLFAEQLAFTLLDHGHIEVVGGRCRARVPLFSADEVVVPDSLEGLLTSRIDAVSPHAALTAKVASVIGREFTEEQLAAIHPLRIDGQALVESIEELISQRIIRPAYLGRHHFWHALTRDTAHGLLPHRQRQSLHAALAEWYESQAVLTDSDTLAHHYLQAEDWDRATLHLERSASAARRSFSNREAALHLARLRQLASAGSIVVGDDVLARWRRWEAEALVGLGRYGEARTRYREALALWGRPFPSSAGRILLGLAGQSALQLAGRTRWIGRQPARDQEGAGECARILQMIAQLAYYDQRLPELLYCTISALHLAEESGNPEVISRANGAMAVAAGLSRLGWIARRCNRRAIEQAEVAGGRETLAYAHLLHGILHYSACRWQQAEEGFKTALELYELLGARADWDVTNAAYAYQLLFQGRWEEATDRLGRVPAEASLQVALWSAAGKLVVALMTGVDPELGVSDTLQRALEAGGSEKGDAILGWGVLAAAHARSGHQMDAWRAVDHADRHLSGLPASTAYTMFGLYGVLRVASGAAETTSDPTIRMRMRKRARRVRLLLGLLALQNQVARPLSRLASAQRARFAWLMGWRLRRALALADRLGTQYFGAVAAVELARLGGASLAPDGAGRLEQGGWWTEKRSDDRTP